MLIAAAFYGGWKGLSVLVARERDRARKLLRYWWPTAMVAWSWLMLLATSFPSASAWLGQGLDVLLILFFAINFVGAIIGNGLLTTFIDWNPWAKGAVASVTVWLIWYGIIRGWEWWSGRNAGMPSVVE